MMMPPLRKKLMFGTIFLGNGVISYSIQNQNDFCCVCNMFELTQDTTTWIHTYTHTFVVCILKWNTFCALSLAMKCNRGF